MHANETTIQRISDEKPQPGFSIAEGGPFDQAVRKARHAGIASGNGRPLVDTIEDCIKQMRSEQLHPRYSSQQSPAETFASALFLDHGPEYRALAFCVACHEGAHDYADKLFDAAANFLSTHLDDWKAVLAELLPQDIITEATLRRDEAAYQAGTHASAADDWSVFEHNVLRESSHGAITLSNTSTLSTLDAAARGLRGLLIVGAETGLGKTSLLLQLVLEALRNNADTAAIIYSLDLPKHVMYRRLWCHEAAMTYQELVESSKCPRKDSQLREAKVRLRADILPRLQVHELSEFGQQGFTLDSMRRHWKVLHRASGCRRLIVVIDPFQRMRLAIESSNELERDVARLELIHQFRQWARSDLMPEGPPVLVASKIRKSEHHRNELRNDDLLGSGQLASHADVVMMMWNAPGAAGKADGVEPVTLRITKGREGVDRVDIPLWFHHRVLRFSDTEPEQRKSASTTSPDSPKKKPAIDPLAGS